MLQRMMTGALLVGCLAGLIYGATQEWPGWTKWLWLIGVAGSVLTVVQKGYQLNGRLLRPARVIVAAEPPTSE